MKLRRISFFSVVFLTLLRNISGQGFVNLGFESATLFPIPGDGYNRVDFAQALPGWTGSLGGVPATRVLTNNLFLDTAGIAIMDHNWSGPLGLIQGNYTVVIMS